MVVHLLHQRVKVHLLVVYLYKVHFLHADWSTENVEECYEGLVGPKEKQDWYESLLHLSFEQLPASEYAKTGRQHSVHHPQSLGEGLNWDDGDEAVV